MGADVDDVDDDPTPMWLIEQFVRLGFTATDAVTLEEARADYRAVARALEHGCTHELAIAIFT